MEYSELCLHEVVVVNPQQWIVPVAMARSSYKYKIKDRNFISDEIERIMLTPESDDLSDDSLERNEMAQAQSSQCYSDQQHILIYLSLAAYLLCTHLQMDI